MQYMGVIGMVLFLDLMVMIYAFGINQTFMVIHLQILVIVICIMNISLVKNRIGGKLVEQL